MLRYEIARFHTPKYFGKLTLHKLSEHCTHANTRTFPLYGYGS